jgi:uncharacterized membrane protein YfcA
MVLLPLLISVLGVPPILAVGSDAVINCITKIGAGGLHWRRGNVSWRLLLNLGYGSIPGATLGVMILARMRATYGEGVNGFLRIAIGILLVVIPMGYLFKVRSTIPSAATPTGSQYSFGVTLIGFIAGVLVGVTSIGTGSVILVLLLVFYNFLPSLLVGTDIVHGVLLAGLTGLLQLRLGNVDLLLVACVLIGSIPGGVLGAYLTSHISPTRLKQILLPLLMAVGARLLWWEMVHAN